MFHLPPEMFPLTASDVALLIDWFLAVVLALYFAVGHPRVWYRDRLGWVIFSYALATVGLLTLIVYGIVFGQKIDEIVRFLVSAALGVALVAKVNAVRRERAVGRMATDRTYSTREKTRMTIEEKPAESAAYNIWYKGQRVLRSLIQAGIPAFLAFALVLPQLIDALGLPVDSELRLWLVGVGAAVTAVAAALSRIMAIPAVNKFFTKFGLGSVPKAAVAAEENTATGAVKTFVVPDEKVVKDG